MTVTRVGDLRPSQLLWSFGTGSLVDLPNFSVVVLGLDDWEESRCLPVNEERLLMAVRSRLGPQVQALMSPPISPESEGRFNPFAPEARIGVPVAPFPEWLRCPVCQTLAPISSGLFQLKDNPHRPDLVQYVHTTCTRAKGRPPTAVPARFMLACAAGHLDEFPWRPFVHRGSSGCRGQLKFYEVGASLETANLMVECAECGAKRSMVEAFGEDGTRGLPRCRGRHPHLRGYSTGCTEDPRAILLGASNSWFSETLSVLSVPTRAGQLDQLVDDHWQPILATVTSLEVLKAFRQARQLPMFVEFRDDEIWTAIQAKKERESGHSAGAHEEELDLKGPEWDVFANPDPALESPDFKLERIAPPDDLSDVLEAVVLGHRLREVSALTGFTRLQAPGEIGGNGPATRRAPLSNDRPRWVPATAVKGEGIFLQFKWEAVSKWLEGSAVQNRTSMLERGHRDWRGKRQLEPTGAGFPGALYVMLHSLAHAFMNELAMECGYNAASIRERIYAAVPGGDDRRAGILVYTAAPDSEGTLGGLVSLGAPEELSRLLGQALERAKLCASDPLCSEHDPRTDGSLHGAACHACMFSPETSCEAGNRYLDRALLVRTFRTEDAAFFAD